MPRRAFVTVVTRNYAHFAQTLLQSCREHHPECDLFVCYVDRPPQSWTETVPGTHVIYGDQLQIQNWHRFCFQHTPFELSCALKPFVMAEVLQRGYDEVIYLDGDMAVYGPLSDVFQALDQHSIVITPHLLRPLPVDGQRPHEAAFLVSGAYNAGFFAIRASDSARAFLQWWQEMCLHRCIVDLAASLFVDQKWLELVPGMFEGVHILRSPGYNAGHWSLSQFPISELNHGHHNSVEPKGQFPTTVAIGGVPLVLFHFSGMIPDKPHEYQRSQTRTTLAANPPLEKLVNQYHASLMNAGMSTCAEWGCEYDSLSDGTTIHRSWREAIRRNHRRLVNIQNPFDVAANSDLPARFTSLQPNSYRWRRDWQLQRVKERGLSGQVRRTTSQLKRVFRGLRSRWKAA